MFVSRRGLLSAVRTLIDDLVQQLPTAAGRMKRAGVQAAGGVLPGAAQVLRPKGR